MVNTSQILKVFNEWRKARDACADLEDICLDDVRSKRIKATVGQHSLDVHSLNVLIPSMWFSHLQMINA